MILKKSWRQGQGGPSPGSACDVVSGNKLNLSLFSRLENIIKLVVFFDRLTVATFTDVPTYTVSDIWGVCSSQSM